MSSEEAKTPGEIVGAHVRDLRRAAGLSQGELADLMEQLGYSWVRQTVGEVEAGRRRLAWDELMSLSAIFDMAPTALIAGPSQSTTYGEVKVGERSIPAAEFAALWTWPRLPTEGPLKGPARQAVDRLLEGSGIRRPWADQWRGEDGAPGLGFRDARDKALAGLSRYPGPIYVLVGDEPVETGTTVPPWGTNVRFRLEPGEPYVARDEWEAERLAEMEKQGFVRRISREEAYRIRKGKR